MGFQIACQTITFGPQQFERYPEVFAAMRKAGYTGVESGYRHLAHLPANEIRKMLADAGLKLAAAHQGGNLEEPAPSGKGRTVIDEILDFIAVLGTNRVMYSGLKFQDEEQFTRQLAMIGRAAEKCRARGAALLYHNHWYEFSDNWRVIHGLLERGSQAIGFCPDVGWVHKGGADVIAFLEKIKGRIGAVHYKDFLTAQPDARDFCTLGEGVTPLDKVTGWLAANEPDAWVIAEQDRSDLTPEQAVARNADYLKRTVLGRN